MTTGAVIVVEGVSAAGTSVGAASSAGSELHPASAMQRPRIPIVRVFIFPSFFFSGFTHRQTWVGAIAETLSCYLLLGLPVRSF